MKPPVFAYHRARSVDEALALLAEHEDAKPLAGGQSLIPAMNFRLAAPAVLVDLGELGALRGITRKGAGIRIGAMTTHAAVEADPLVSRHAPLLAEAMPHIAHPQIRNRGTIGGSLAHADPAAELPAVMLALEASLVLRSTGGERRVRARDFFTGLFATALQPGELVTFIELAPPAPRTGTVFEEFARRHGDFALTGVAVALSLDESGRCDALRIALFSVGDGPVLAERAAGVLAGRSPTAELIRAAAELAGNEDIDPPADLHATAAYRRQLARVLTRRALSRAVERARLA